MNPNDPAAAHSTTPTAADLDAARLLLARLGVSPADLLTTAPDRAPAPTFAEYIPVVRAAVPNGTRRVYGSYWNRIVEHWGTRRLDEPTPSEINQLAEHLKANVTVRRNARGGRGATEHLIAALRCLYRHAENDGHLAAADNPARKVAKPRRLPSTRRAVPDTRLAEINRIAATTGNAQAVNPVRTNIRCRVVSLGVQPSWACRIRRICAAERDGLRQRPGPSLRPVVAEGPGAAATARAAARRIRAGRGSRRGGGGRIWLPPRSSPSGGDALSRSSVSGFGARCKSTEPGNWPLPRACSS